jgi:hypothetical protein
MSLPRFTCFLGLLAALAARAEVATGAPDPAAQTSGAPSARSAVGPFWFDEPTQTGGRVSGVRPFYTRWTRPAGDLEEVTVLYPLYYFRTYADTYEWSIFKLITHYGKAGGGPPGPDNEAHTFDIWPVYFSSDSGDPATSDHAIFPLYGRIRGRFALNDFSWVLFPVYAHSNNHDSATNWLVWPFLHETHGQMRGFGVWPLYSQELRSGYYDRHYALWPLIWSNTVEPPPAAPAGAPVGHSVGFLPFYTSDRSYALVSENYLWPFFGYSHQTAPSPYDEVRYFWPFLVQGRGPDHYLNRWGPVYTHSIFEGMEVTWEPWPLVQRLRWTDDGVAQSRTRLLYFLYWRMEQRKLGDPQAAPAVKLHVWPLLSLWDNGAGRRQLEMLSPLEVFFPDNREVRASWSPLFSLLRYDRRAPGDTRVSLLWNTISWEARASEGRTAFRLGPLLTVESSPAGRRIALGRGLLGLERPAAGRGWRPFALQFSPHPTSLAAAIR